MDKPTQFTDELAEAVLSRIRDGESLKMICVDVDMPSTQTVWAWQNGDSGAPSSWHDVYTRARRAQADAFAADVIAIADAVDEVALLAAARAVDALPDDANETEKRRAYFFAKKRSVEGAKLQIDARKWTAARMHPSRWGDRVTHEIAISDDKPIRLDLSNVSTEHLERIVALEAQLMGAQGTTVLPANTQDTESTRVVGGTVTRLPVKTKPWLRERVETDRQAVVGTE